MTDLTFRALRPDDLDDLHSVVSNWSVVRQLGGWPWPPQRNFTKGRSVPHEGDGFIWGICHNDRVIGSIGITGGAVGYMLRQDMLGQGIGTKALRHALATAFMADDCDRMRATTWIDNEPSHRLLLGCGFVHYRTEYIHAKARGYPVLSRQYRLLRKTWHRLSTAAQ